ncbi:MAG TPA: maleylpyruvate isomerase family mycothiol-dependent enzyme [Nocardioidaceae bacterium]|nr:maleylpyruvate isomerase family mycothiol-dependent enzyme [Nocardioidaceae bacterium]
MNSQHAQRAAQNAQSTPTAQTASGSKESPWLPGLDRQTATRLAATEYERVADLLAQLTPERWAAPTDCPGWDVRAMAGHMLGMTQMIATWREMVRQQLAAGRRAKREGVETIDALTALQVEKNADLTADELVDQLRKVAPGAVRNRRRAPGLMRRQTLPENGEWWTMGYLFDVILTRDPFVHRIDITRTTGVPMVATAEHEGVIIADVVTEWAERHGAPYELELTGPAGGHWKAGDGERITMDALEFCRALSGRAPAPGLLATQVPF